MFWSVTNRFIILILPYTKFLFEMLLLLFEFEAFGGSCYKEWTGIERNCKRSPVDNRRIRISHD